MNFLIKIIRFMPHKLALSFGRLVGRLLHLILWEKVNRAEARCVLSLGVGVTIARKIVRDSYINFGMSVVEFICLPKIIKKVDNIVDFPKPSIEFLRSALSRGHGAILMCQHMANWEYAAARVIFEGIPLHSIYTPQRDKGVEALIMSTRQDVSGMSMIDSDTGLREIFRVLKSGETLVVMQDLDARGDGVPSEFLGLPARTHDGIVKLYRKFKCPVICAEYWRDERDPSKHHIILNEILSDKNDINGLPFGEDIKESIRMCNMAVEKRVKERPEQWLWLLDRWEYTLGKKI